MASGDVVGILGDIVQPSTLFAPFDVRVGGSTPAENVPVYKFDDATAWYIDIYGRLHGYAGGGLTVSFDWMAASATSNSVVFGAAFRRIEDDAEDLDASHTYDFNHVTDACANLSGEVSRAAITFTHGADMDSLANGEAFILRLYRNAADGSDNMSGNAQIKMSTLAIVES